MTLDADDPFGPIVIVVGGLGVVFLALLGAVQFADPSLQGLVTIPLVLAVPLVLGGLYYHYRSG